MGEPCERLPHLLNRENHVTETMAQPVPSGTATPMLEARNISKSFGSVQALTDVDFEVRPGEVMKAVVIERPREVAYVELDAPVAGPGEVVVRSRVAGVCRTDLEIVEGGLTDPRWVRFPVVPGHEWAGTIAELGEGVDDLMGAMEGEMILDLIRDLKAEGHSMIVVAHNYVHVLEICDRVNLLQHGRITLDRLSSETSAEELTELVAREYRRLRDTTSSAGSVAGEENGPETPHAAEERPGL